MTAFARLRAYFAYRPLRRAEGGAAPFAGTPSAHRLDFPDPYVVRIGDAYFAYGTQAEGMNLPVLRSDDLSHWELMGDALPTLPSWAASGRTWSPAILPAGDSFVMYYAVREPISDRQCIAVAVSDTPEGPFVDDIGGPLVFQRERGGSIDPSAFVDSDGRAYLFWKSDDNAIGRPASLWGQALSNDGRRLLGHARELMRHDRDWERPLIEAPAVLKADGRYYLFYSANWWESERYCIGYAVAPAVLGPYSKITRRGPWMVGGKDAAGPGGQEFFLDRDGAVWMAYHAWTPGSAGYERGGMRSLRITRLAFIEGRPVLQSSDDSPS